MNAFIFARTMNLHTLGTFSRPMTSIVLKKVCAAILMIKPINALCLTSSETTYLLPNSLGEQQIVEILKHIFCVVLSICLSAISINL